MKQRVCVIGAGPSGMGLLGTLNKLKDQGSPVEVTCYEKQDRPGGLWNLTWRTGTDEFGEPVHCSQYQDLFSNGPKECIELPSYTFKDHFGKAIPSFPPRPVLIDYLRGYWKHLGVADADVKTNHCVRDVKFDDQSNIFTVRVTDLKENVDVIEEFDYLVVATGHFSTPNYPKFAGVETYKGRILHSHNFRNAREFKGQNILVVGSSYSAEDIALQCYKFGAESVTISYRTTPMGFHWPKGIEEVPLLTNLDGKTCHFKDGSSREIDAIIMCTGYLHSFPFMPTELRLKSANIFFPPNLYRSLQWHGVSEGTKSADGRLFYIGMQAQFYTYTMFMTQGLWVANVIKGLLQTPPYNECRKIIEADVVSNADLTDFYKQVDSQSAYVKQLADDVGYTTDLDVRQMFYEWGHDKHEDILTYRDKSFTSKFSGDKAPVHSIPWLKCYDDSVKDFVGE